MVVEIVSPNDTQQGGRQTKASMWLSFGVRLVWVVQPDTRYGGRVPSRARIGQPSMRTVP